MGKRRQVIAHEPCGEFSNLGFFPYRHDNRLARQALRFSALDKFALTLGVCLIWR